MLIIDDMTTEEVIARAGDFGCFVNETTLEPELFTGGLGEAMKLVIEQELSPRRATLTGYRRGWMTRTSLIMSGC
ncbi:Uncharacterised protein [Klebsiella pneumoniae]|uniref:Uncharacterized protein n=1 Tax=Klebsiella pneumoniae TaxID=573 RepID=A0A377WCE7_KLEPN|nr:Uncharacterised protein [Klebsiella pneumoniae]